MIEVEIQDKCSASDWHIARFAQKEEKPRGGGSEKPELCLIKITAALMQA